jgi:dTDP-4-dehydrorhamnose reductase
MVEKILLFGSSGMLGRYIYSYFKKNNNYLIKCIHYKILDNNFELLEKILIENNIDEKTCIINCIGLIPQRKDILSNDSNYYLINTLFPNILWFICKKYNAKMIQPTTDCVYSGKKGNYLETDKHDEINSYGTSKSLGEPNCTIIRSSIIGREFVIKNLF